MMLFARDVNPRAPRAVEGRGAHLRPFPRMRTWGGRYFTTLCGARLNGTVRIC